MNFTLVRTDFLPTGIFGKLISEDNSLLLECLEHSYLSGATWAPKVPLGIYTCVRGTHQLEGMTKPFECFELKNVPGHTDILIHRGNQNSDSAGCLLVGEVRDGNRGILSSQMAFERFMNFQSNVDEFQLEIK